MLRIGLSVRLVAIAGIALLLMWLALLSSFYLSNGLKSAASLPSASQISAIARMVRGAGPEELPLVLQALNSAILTVHVEPDLAGSQAGLEDDVLSEPRFAPYRQALGEDLLAITRLSRSGERSPLPRFFGGPGNPVEFAIALKGSEVLVIQTRTPFLVAVFGLPAGLGAGLVGTLVALAAFVLLNHELRPLRRLAAAVDRIDPASEPVPIPDVRFVAPETRSLIHAFERLQTRLHAMIRARFALIGGVQHDVRSFATRLRLRAEQIPDDAERERAIADIADMIALLDNALLAGRAGAGGLDEELLEIAPIVEAEVQDAAGTAPRGSLRISPAARDALVLGDRLALRRIVSNLIDNAVKYGGLARVSLDVDGAFVSLIVDDNGPGIPAAEREVLFEPFVRLEPSRARKTGGAGLGLAVVRTLVEAQGGQIGVGEAEGGGARFTVRLPLFTAGDSRSFFRS